jgi:hypothetical protein
MSHKAYIIHVCVPEVDFCLCLVNGRSYRRVPSLVLVINEGGERGMSRFAPSASTSDLRVCSRTLKRVFLESGGVVGGVKGFFSYEGGARVAFIDAAKG